MNGIAARLPNLLRWLAETRPHVACFQELKLPHDKFPEAAIREAGYGVILHGQKSFNGVAILARGADPVEVRRVLPDANKPPMRKTARWEGVFPLKEPPISLAGLTLGTAPWSALCLQPHELGEAVNTLTSTEPTRVPLM